MAEDRGNSYAHIVGVLPDDDDDDDIGALNANEVRHACLYFSYVAPSEKGSMMFLRFRGVLLIKTAYHSTV